MLTQNEFPNKEMKLFPYNENLHKRTTRENASNTPASSLCPTYPRLPKLYDRSGASLRKCYYAVILNSKTRWIEKFF